MAKIKVNVNICGNDYVILSDESEAYVKEVASEVDKKKNEALKSNIRKSLVKASILVSMNYCDGYKKLQDEKDFYLQAIEEDQTEIRELKNKISELNNQIENLKKNRHR